MLIGTSWRDSTRRSAVTTISCSASELGASACASTGVMVAIVAAAMHSCFICNTPEAAANRRFSLKNWSPTPDPVSVPGHGRPCQGWLPAGASLAPETKEVSIPRN